MPSPLLERLTFQFPGTHPEFHAPFLGLLAPLGEADGRSLDLPASDAVFFPRLSIAFKSADSKVAADFLLSGGGITVNIENITGAQKENPLPYRPLAIDEVPRRLAAAGRTIAGIDHIGFNLPWFGPGLHPRIRELREKLAAACLYHEYPSGEPWDFILPGTAAEIAERESIDYSKTRRPKFELVSFGEASTPLIQIDLGVDARLPEIRRLFPEALVAAELRQMWIYLANPYPVDVCLVLNEQWEGDWSPFFAGHRLPAAAGRGRGMDDPPG
jgi:hypothetical protein